MTTAENILLRCPHLPDSSHMPSTGYLLKSQPPACSSHVLLLASVPLDSPTSFLVLLKMLEDSCWTVCVSSKGCTEAPRLGRQICL